MSAIEQMSYQLFGTTDYSSVLAVLPPYDAAVKQFKSFMGECHGEEKRDYDQAEDQ